jgi:tetratricopeptide (TPR) repeat protein
VRWARKAIARAEAADDVDALGTAYFVMGWASSELGTEKAEPFWRRSLEAYRKSGNAVRYAGQLSNLGAACEWDNRWDDALSYYEQARAECLKIGSTVDAGVARMNAAEILTERGELAEAEALLLELLPLWRAVQYRNFLGVCLALLGRVALRAGRYEEALGRFDEARSHFLHIGAQQEALDVDARIAECRVFLDDPDAALALAAGALERVDASATKLVALLERVRGFALYRRGDVTGARRALEASLAAGRSRRDSFQIAQTLLALIAVDRAEGVEPSPAIVSESSALLASLKVRNAPSMPLVAF